jgi:hypothetical protein
MSNKFKVCLTILSLIICSVTFWVSTQTVFAASISITCADGSEKSCSGFDCTGRDTSDSGGVFSDGYCSCQRSDGSTDSKFCGDKIKTFYYGY